MAALCAIVFGGLLTTAGATLWLVRSGRAVPAPWVRLRETPWRVVTSSRTPGRSAPPR